MLPSSYYLNRKRDNVQVENLTDPVVLDSLLPHINAYNDVVTSSTATNRKVWLGETGSVSGGGVEGLTNTFAASFM